MERDLKCKVYEKMRSNAVIFQWYEDKINELNDSHKEDADRLRRQLMQREIKLQERINKMSYERLIFALGE